MIAVFSKWIGAALLLLLRAYRAAVSPLLGARCRFYPSCSAYAEESIRLKGPLHGTIAAAQRLLRCHPFHAGGFDPVKPRPAKSVEERQ